MMRTPQQISDMANKLVVCQDFSGISLPQSEWDNRDLTALTIQLHGMMIMLVQISKPAQFQIPEREIIYAKLHEIHMKSFQQSSPEPLDKPTQD